MLLSGVASLAGLAPAWAETQIVPLAARLTPQTAVTFAIATGAAIFFLTVALFYHRESNAWRRREAALHAELRELRDVKDRVEVLIGSERQVVIGWDGRDAAPRVEGDPTSLGEDFNANRLLAFGAWLVPGDAAAVDAALDRLRERGESFRMTLRTTKARFVDVEGRAVGGRAILRLRDVTGDRHDLLRTRREMERVATGAEMMRTMLASIPQPVWLRDGEGRLEWANPAFLAAVEATDLDDARRRGLELLEKAAREDACARRREGRSFQIRSAAIVAGARRTLDVVECPAANGWAGIAVDVSELESIRADLQRQMDAHVRTLDQLPTAVAIFDARQRLVFHNSAYRALFELDRAFLESGPTDGEVLDRLRAERRLPEQADFRTWKAGVLAAYRSIEAQENWWHLPDRRTLRVVANPNPQGGLTYLFDDVSERISLESQFNTLIQVQSETLDALREGVAVFGSDGRLKLANRAFVESWRLPPTLVSERPHVDTVVASCQKLSPTDGAWNEIRALVAGAVEARTGVQARFERVDGLICDCAAEPLPDGATLLTFVDTTATVNVERALTERNDALERASRLRDDFVHHVSYELRSPLTTIIGFTQLLGDETVGGLNDRQREYASHIMRSSGALLAIINDILDLASIDTGSLELVPEDVDVHATVEAAVRGLEDRIAESALRLELDVPSDIGSFVADGKRVRQVLFNLLSNAIGFSQPGQTVRVSARRTESEVVLRVSDQGRGIAPEVVARVFERFESHTLGTRHRGVGLGLAIVRSFVELHGGRVELSSTPGSGTTVTCFFPARGPQRLAAE